MWKALFVAALLVLQAPVFSQSYPGDWSDVKPKEPLKVGAIYIHPYTWVMHVLGKQTLLDGSEVYIVHELRGNTVCHEVRTHVCGIPGNTVRGSWVPVKTGELFSGQ